MGQGEGAGFAASALGGAAKGQGKEAELGEEEGRGVRSTRYLRRTLVGSRTARPKGLQGRAGARVRPQPGLPGTLGIRGGLTHPAPCFSPKRAGWGAPCPPPPPAQPSPDGLPATFCQPQLLGSRCHQPAHEPFSSHCLIFCWRHFICMEINGLFCLSNPKAIKHLIK